MKRLKTRIRHSNVVLAETILDGVGSMAFFYVTVIFNAAGLAMQPWQPELVVLNISNAFQLQLVSLTLFAAARSEAKHRRNEALLRKDIGKLTEEIEQEEQKSATKKAGRKNSGKYGL